MGEALFLNRSRDLEFKDYIELNDLNELLELRNHENEDLGPTIEEGDIINELNGEIVETRDDNVMVDKIDEYPSICDYDRKIKDNCANNLKFSCMIGNVGRTNMNQETNAGNCFAQKIKENEENIQRIPKTIVRDVMYFKERMLLTAKDKAGVNLDTEENYFMLMNAYGDD
ncbi:hypothetical protein Tco_0162843 [Tanacetum coccineum]